MSSTPLATLLTAAALSLGLFGPAAAGSSTEPLRLAASPAGQQHETQGVDTMPKDIWINLPTRDVARARAFFTSIGFSLNPHFGNSDESVSLVIGEKEVIVMLWPEEKFSNFADHKVSDPERGSEVLLSIGVESRDAVDELARKVEAAGGTVFGKPAEIQSWMYGMGFVDLDGHRWNAVYMDMSRMPQQ